MDSDDDWGAAALPAVPAGSDALGGYLETENTGAATGWPWPAGLRLASARTALRLWLQARAPCALWMPWFVCPSLLEAPRRCGVPVRRYALDEQFRPLVPPRLAEGECLLVVNHFGLGGGAARDWLAGYPEACLVFDHAQALFAPPAGTATLYSPRKFVGVPDGGLLVSRDRVVMPAAVDTGSARRLQARELRRTQGAEAGYAAYLQAERSLDDQPLLAMSPLTESLLARIDAAEVARRRRRNYAFLHAALAPHNRLQLPLEADAVPLCYPFWPRRPMARAEFHRARIYLPAYWPGLVDEPEAPAAERCWAAQWLHLPIDQRCEPALLQRHLVEPILRHQLGGGPSTIGA